MSTNQMEEEALKEFHSNPQIGIALFEWETLQPLYENDLFLSWIPNTKTGKSLTNRISDLNIDRIKKRATKGSSISIEHEIKFNNRSKVIKLNFSKTPSSSLFINAFDYTKEKELEYLLDSHVRMAENDKKRLEKSLRQIKEQKQELIKANFDLERERNSVELRALQAVINPHFVSNCLASIQNFIVGNNTEMSINYLSHFGKLMRMSFEQSYNDYVSIAEILQLLKTYAAIEKMRIHHPWDLIFEIDEELDIENLKIPPLLIQPFLENAIWHGISNKKVGGKVIVSFKKMDDITLKCVIEDNGIGRKANDEKRKSKVTLHSLNVTGKRLDILWEEYKKKYQIMYIDIVTKEGKPCGTKVELFIPISF